MFPAQNGDVNNQTGEAEKDERELIDRVTAAINHALAALRTNPETARRDPQVIRVVRALRAPETAVRMCTRNSTPTANGRHHRS